MARSAVHPRVCGELWIRMGESEAGAGSSPRVRGTRRALGRLAPGASVHPRVCGELPGGARRPCLGVRFIPACAGNSDNFLDALSGGTVHPRVCGELGNVVEDTQGCIGSSPRVRGTLRRTRQAVQPCRFIPACAGNSAWPISSALISVVHPRVCGELGRRPWSPAAPAGSSPRVRGTQFRASGVIVLSRFIPACAGNSAAFPPRSPAAAVHPRVCGELRRVFVCSMSDLGSSPRVRGTRLPAHRGEDGRRFIPACAGNSPAPAKSRRTKPVHPRVCGELVGRTLCRVPKSRFIPACAGNSDRLRGRKHGARGSSPRVRGTRLEVARPGRLLRFIPACAGNSFSSARTSGGSFGSSPRVRGTRRRDGAGREGRRFIPACAGNS